MGRFPSNQDQLDFLRYMFIPAFDAYPNDKTLRENLVWERAHRKKMDSELVEVLLRSCSTIKTLDEAKYKEDKLQSLMRGPIGIVNYTNCYTQ